MEIVHHDIQTISDVLHDVVSYKFIGYAFQSNVIGMSGMGILNKQLAFNFLKTVLVLLLWQEESQSIRRQSGDD